MTKRKNETPDEYKERKRPYYKQYDEGRADDVKRIQKKRETTKQWKIDNVEKWSEYTRKYYKSKGYALGLKRKYGISVEEYQAILDSQDGKCAICGRAQSDYVRAFGIDHNHKSNQIRGILCSRCNSYLGFIKDDIEVLQKAISYLEKS